ncbi:hypothetical protein ACWGR4_28175 [Embleya sp. NPDC055664]
MSFFALQSEHPSSAVDKYDKTCVWFPENAAGSAWSFYCPSDDKTKPEDEHGQWSVFQLLGGDRNTMDFALSKWRSDKLNLTGKALAAAGPQNVPSTLTREQNESFMLEGAEKALSPCAIMDGSWGGGGEKHNVVCVDVRADLTAKKHPCSRAPEKSRALCIQEHDVWREYAKPAAGDLPTCDAGSKVSTCPDANVVTQNSQRKTEDDNFLSKPITFIREQSKVAVRLTLLWWVTAPDPLISDDHTDCDPTSEKQTDRTKPVPCSRNTTDFLTRHTNPFTYFLALACVIFAGFKLAYTRDVSSVKDVIKGTLTLVMVTGSAIFLVNVAVRACQAFTDWIIVRGLSPEADGTTTSQKALQGAADRFAQSLEGFDSFVLFLLAALIIIASNMVQYFYMTARLFFVIVLTGTLPLTAAATSTAAGLNLFRRHISYLVAFIFVKPASVIIFVAGARLWAPPGYEALDYNDQFRGLFVLALVTLVGPATVRVVFAMTGPAAGSNAANIGAAGAVLTVGARSVGAASNLVRHRSQGGN